MSSLLQRALKIRRDEGLGTLVEKSIKFTINHPAKFLLDFDNPLGDAARNIWYRRRYVECTYETRVGPVSTRVPPETPYSSRAPNEYEPKVVQLLARCLSPDSTFYDIGAHYGYFVEVAELCGVVSDRIHAFESSRMNCHALSLNCDDAVHITETLVSDRTTAAELQVDDYEHLDVAPPDVVKMDIEGGELAALRGMEATLSEYRPEILVEIHPFSLGPEERTLLEFLRDRGYVLATSLHHVDKVGSEKPLLDIEGVTMPSTEIYDSDLPYLLFATRDAFPPGVADIITSVDNVDTET